MKRRVLGMGRYMEQMHPRDTVFLYVEKEQAKQATMTAYAFVAEHDSDRHPDPAEISRWIADRAGGMETVSYTHLTLPTIYSV